MSRDLPRDMLWSIQAELFTLSFGPYYLSPYLEQWFYCGGEWASRAFIVNVDFVQKTYIPEHMAACSLLRGAHQLRPLIKETVE